MVISYSVDISKGYFPNLGILAKRFSLVSLMGSSPWGIHSLAEGIEMEMEMELKI